MRICIIFVCLLLVLIGSTSCFSFHRQSLENPIDSNKKHSSKLLPETDSSVAESKKSKKKYEKGGKKSSKEKGFKKAGGGEYDLKHHSSHGEEGVESYNKTSSWEKNKKGSHHKELGDEKKNKSKHSSYYAKDPDYYDDSKEMIEDSKVHAKKSHSPHHNVSGILFSKFW